MKPKHWIILFALSLLLLAPVSVAADSPNGWTSFTHEADRLRRIGQQAMQIRCFGAVSSRSGPRFRGTCA